MAKLKWLLLFLGYQHIVAEECSIQHNALLASVRELYLTDDLIPDPSYATFVSNTFHLLYCIKETGSEMQGSVPSIVEISTYDEREFTINYVARNVVNNIIDTQSLLWIFKRVWFQKNSNRIDSSPGNWSFPYQIYIDGLDLKGLLQARSNWLAENPFQGTQEPAIITAAVSVLEASLSSFPPELDLQDTLFSHQINPNSITLRAHLFRLSQEENNRKCRECSITARLAVEMLRLTKDTASLPYHRISVLLSQWSFNSVFPILSQMYTDYSQRKFPASSLQSLQDAINVVSQFSGVIEPYLAFHRSVISLTRKQLMSISGLDASRAKHYYKNEYRRHIGTETEADWLKKAVSEEVNEILLKGVTRYDFVNMLSPLLHYPILHSDSKKETVLFKSRNVATFSNLQAAINRTVYHFYKSSLDNEESHRLRILSDFTRVLKRTLYFIQEAEPNYTKDERGPRTGKTSGDAPNSFGDIDSEEDEEDKIEKEEDMKKDNEGAEEEKKEQTDKEKERREQGVPMEGEEAKEEECEEDDCEEGTDHSNFWFMQVFGGSRSASNSQPPPKQPGADKARSIQAKGTNAPLKNSKKRTLIHLPSDAVVEEKEDEVHSQSSIASLHSRGSIPEQVEKGDSSSKPSGAHHDESESHFYQKSRRASSTIIGNVSQEQETSIDKEKNIEGCNSKSLKEERGLVKEIRAQWDKKFKKPVPAESKVAPQKSLLPLRDEAKEEPRENPFSVVLARNARMAEERQRKETLDVQPTASEAPVCQEKVKCSTAVPTQKSFIKNVNRNATKFRESLKKWTTNKFSRSQEKEESIPCPQVQEEGVIQTHSEFSQTLADDSLNSAASTSVIHQGQVNDKEVLSLNKEEVQDEIAISTGDALAAPPSELIIEEAKEGLQTSTLSNDATHTLSHLDEVEKNLVVDSHINPVKELSKDSEEIINGESSIIENKTEASNEVISPMGRHLTPKSQSHKMSNNNTEEETSHLEEVVREEDKELSFILEENVKITENKEKQAHSTTGSASTKKSRGTPFLSTIKKFFKPTPRRLSESLVRKTTEEIRLIYLNELIADEISGVPGYKKKESIKKICECIAFMKDIMGAPSKDLIPISEKCEILKSGGRYYENYQLMFDSESISKPLDTQEQLTHTLFFAFRHLTQVPALFWMRNDIRIIYPLLQHYTDYNDSSSLAFENPNRDAVPPRTLPTFLSTSSQQIQPQEFAPPSAVPVASVKASQAQKKISSDRGGKQTVSQEMGNTTSWSSSMELMQDFLGFVSSVDFFTGGFENYTLKKLDTFFTQIYSGRVYEKFPKIMYFLSVVQGLYLCEASTRSFFYGDEKDLTNYIQDAAVRRNTVNRRIGGNDNYMYKKDDRSPTQKSFNKWLVYNPTVHYDIFTLNYLMRTYMLANQYSLNQRSIQPSSPHSLLQRLFREIDETNPSVISRKSAQNAQGEVRQMVQKESVDTGKTEQGISHSNRQGRTTTLQEMDKPSFWGEVKNINRKIELLNNVMKNIVHEYAKHTLTKKGMLGNKYWESEQTASSNSLLKTIIFTCLTLLLCLLIPALVAYFLKRSVPTTGHIKKEGDSFFHDAQAKPLMAGEKEDIEVPKLV